jgi:hypothetical protein
MKLNQIIAIANGEKTKMTNSLTEYYHKCSKIEMFSGFSRSYSPKDEDGEKCQMRRNQYR